MASDIPIDVDRFASSIDSILGEVSDMCGEGVERAAVKQTRETAKKLREQYTDGIGVHEWSERYRQGFRSHVDKAGLDTVGEVGNKKEPGLVHLLEKGHVTLTGRRARAFPHMDPAFRDMADGFAEKVGKEIGR
jgi:hypothetical protein